MDFKTENLAGDVKIPNNMTNDNLFGDDMFLGDPFFNTNKDKYDKAGSEVIKQRIETKELLRQIELFLLRSFEKEVEEKDKDGEIRKVLKTFRHPKLKPLCNDLGRYDILLWIQNLVNKHTVQGNSDDAYFKNNMFCFCIEFSVHLEVNKEIYEIEEANIMMLHSSITQEVGHFISRTLYNTEKSMLSGSTIIKETTGNAIKEKKGFWDFLNPK